MYCKMENKQNAIAQVADARTEAVAAKREARREMPQQHARAGSVGRGGAAADGIGISVAGNQLHLCQVGEGSKRKQALLI